MADQKDTTDAELAAVKAVVDAVKNLDPGGRMRALRAAEALMPSQQFMPPGPPPQK